jgi:hypothetical protein
MKLPNKTKQPQKEAATAASLAAQLNAACAAAESHILTIAQKEKAASPLQPLPWHEMNLRLMYGRCACKCALALLERESNGR